MSRDMKTRVTAIYAEGKPGASCVLDVRTMHAIGGSLIVEARQPQPAFGLRVHWAGRRSAAEGADCGSSADLLVDPDDSEVLAMAAGGFGTAASKRMGLTFWRSSAAAQ